MNKNDATKKNGPADNGMPAQRKVLLLLALSLIINVGLNKAPAMSLIGPPAPVVPAKALPTVQPAKTVVPIKVDTSKKDTKVSKFVAKVLKDRHARLKDQVPGLAAAKTTITGFADGRSMTGAYYWTISLTNSSEKQAEAQLRLALPKGAVVSRATLWVDGVAQEAAFNTTQQVSSAYEWVKNGRFRPTVVMCDPLVVTQVSPGHILVKAAPVNPHGEKKLRIGFTAPLRVSRDGQASMRLPYIESANFSFDGMQDVHIESASQISSSDESVAGESQPGGGFLLRGNVEPSVLETLKINVTRPTAATMFATRATHSRPGTYIVARLNTNAAGKTMLNLEKVDNIPDCELLADEPAAHRLSTLWAYTQVEELAKKSAPAPVPIRQRAVNSPLPAPVMSLEMASDMSMAMQLAIAYRIVSSVSGATVLELESDYASTGLSRDMTATVNYRGGSGQLMDAGGGDGAGGEGLSSGPAVILPEPPSAPAPMPPAAPVAPSAGSQLMSMPEPSSPMPAPTPMQPPSVMAPQAAPQRAKPSMAESYSPGPQAMDTVSSRAPKVIQVDKREMDAQAREVASESSDDDDEIGPVSKAEQKTEESKADLSVNSAEQTQYHEAAVPANSESDSGSLLSYLGRILFGTVGSVMLLHAIIFRSAFAFGKARSIGVLESSIYGLALIALAVACPDMVKSIMAHLH